MRVELLGVPGCPHVDGARAVVLAAIRQVGVTCAFTERSGTYASPTVLVEGLDVMTSRPPEPASVPSCRLDLPTEQDLITALRRGPA